MFNITGIDHLVLRTTKAQELIYFYCNILGCKIEKNQPEFKLVQLRAGNNLIDILEVEQAIDTSNKNMEHFCLRVTPFDYEKLTEYFEEKNIAVKRYGQRYGSQGMGWSFYINDPEGNEIELTADLSFTVEPIEFE